jgi:hypothetical protein
MKITRPAAAAAAVALILAACGGGGDDSSDTTVTTAADTTTTAESTTTTEAATTTSSSSSSTSSSTTTTTIPAVPREPLTGVEIASFDDIDPKPALAVKIDNAPGARRNHTGLAVADIVYEEIVEAGITRFAAIFHSTQSDPVGPVRSGRSQDVDIMLPYNQPLFAWSGGNPGVTRIIADSPLTDLNWQKNTGLYYRGPGSTPHNLYSSTERLWGATPPDHPGPPPQQFVYLDDGETFEGEPTAGMDLKMDNIDVQWFWNPETGKFGRAQEGSSHVDKTHGQIAATNVIVLATDYQPSQVDARSPEAQTIGEGLAWVFSDGKVVQGRWKREISLFPFEILTEEGETIALNPGNTWVELARAIPSLDPDNPTAEIEVWGPAE